MNTLRAPGSIISSFLSDGAWDVYAYTRGLSYNFDKAYAYAATTADNTTLRRLIRVHSLGRSRDLPDSFNDVLSDVIQADHIDTAEILLQWCAKRNIQEYNYDISHLGMSTGMLRVVVEYLSTDVLWNVFAAICLGGNAERVRVVLAERDRRGLHDCDWDIDAPITTEIKTMLAGYISDARRVHYYCRSMHEPALCDAIRKYMTWEDWVSLAYGAAASDTDIKEFIHALDYGTDLPLFNIEPGYSDVGVPIIGAIIMCDRHRLLSIVMERVEIKYRAHYTNYALRTGAVNCLKLLA